jgi:hypothetical protein
MAYRHDQRRNQYMNNTFDNLTREIIVEYMNYNHITTIQDVWFHNLKWLVLTDVTTIFKECNRFGLLNFTPKFKINSIELNDFMLYQFYYVSLWEAEDGSEFIITNNSFGCFEGVPAYHYLFVLSPTRIIALTNRANNRKTVFSTFIHNQLTIKKIDNFQTNSYILKLYCAKKMYIWLTAYYWNVLQNILRIKMNYLYLNPYCFMKKIAINWV